MRYAFILLLWVMCGCGRSAAPAASTHPSEVAHPVAESELPTVQLSAEAIARLHLETTSVRENTTAQARLVGGEVVVPPGRTIAVTSPVAGEVHFMQSASLLPGTAVLRGAGLLRVMAIAPTDRDTRARVAREVIAAEANLEALTLRVARNQSLVDERAGAPRILEEAIAARDVAEADLAAARARAATLSRHPLLSDIAMVVRAPSNGLIRSRMVGDGQSVAAGAPLFEIADVDALEVRVPVYSGDLRRLDESAFAQVHRNGDARMVQARFAHGPPTAEPDRGTVDRYLELPADAGFEPGERILVELPLRDVSVTLLVPAAAIVLDAWGGAWVYRCDAARFTRARVDPLRRAGEDMVIAHGPPLGACVVSVGAAELFGAEFPPGH